MCRGNLAGGAGGTGGAGGGKSLLKATTRLEKAGLVLQHPLQAEAADAQQLIDRHTRARRLDHLGLRVDGRDAAAHRRKVLRSHQIHFIQQYAIREGDLLDRLL